MEVSGSKPFSKWVERGIQCLIIYSLVTYFLELEWVKSNNSLEGHRFWIWSERIVALIFTVEYLARWYRAKDRLRYPFTPMAIIDALAVIPFYIGFLVDMQSLRLIRMLRVLRLLKFGRFQPAIQRIGRSFSKSFSNLVAVSVIVFVFVFYASTFIYESERTHQPESFSSYGDAVWWSVVTMTTVGYGDLYPTSTTGRVIGAITIIFGISVFSMLFSVLQEAFQGESDASNHEILARLDRTDQLLLRLAARLDVNIEDEFQKMDEEVVHGS